MKKITQLFSLLVFLLTAWTSVSAQSIFVQEKALKAEDLTNGKIIAFKAISVTNQEWINWGGTSTPQPTEAGSFTVETTDNGIVLKRNSDNLYVGRNGDAIEFVAKEQAAVFTVSCPPLDGTEVTGTHEVVLPEWATNGDYQIRLTNNNSFLNVQAAQTGLPKYATGKGSWSVFMAYDAEGYTFGNDNPEGLPQVGKAYYIKSDNVDANKADQDYYLYDNNGSLALNTVAGGDNYVWTCEKDGENFRFKNNTGKYLAHKTLSDTGYDFKIDPAKKVNEGCLPLSAVAANRYLLVKNGGTGFDQADKTYNKAADGYSSDYIFEEVNTDAKRLIITTMPADASAEFSWNGKTITGSGSFELSEGNITETTLSARVSDPASIYAFEGFYEGDTKLGETVEIAELTENRTITAKFRLDIYSQTYGEKWVRISANRNPGNQMNLPAQEDYLNATPNTAPSDLGSKNQIWCFVGNEEGFKIYNQAAGETLALATESTNYADGTATKMVAAENATEWHLVDKPAAGIKGLNISPKGNEAFGLNPYGGVGQNLKLYNNGDGGNMWGFQMAGDQPLTFQVVINGTPKAMNTQIGQISMTLGNSTNTLNVTTAQTEAQEIYLVKGINLNMKLGSTQYRGYVFKGFQVGDGELQEEIKDLTFDETTGTLTAVYDVDANDPSQYLFYTPGYQNKPYRIPAITTLNNGNILAISDFRWCGADIGFGHVDIVGRISKDNGATWGEQFNIAVGSGISGAKDCGYGDAAVVTDRESGRVLIMCCTGNTFYSNGNRENPLRSARLYSEDNGETWSKPEDITEQMYALLPNSLGQFIGAGKICQSRQVKVGEYYRLYAALCTRPGGNYAIYSDDFGQTWNVLGGNETSCAPSGDEPKCEELPDGSVVLSSRKYSGRYFNIFKYTDVETGEGSWTGVVSSNDVENGLRFNWNSTNGEIQFVKVIKKSDNSFHYMMIQSAPYGKVNEGDADRSNVAIHYKVFDNYFMDSALDLATNWTMGMRLENPKGAYSTMCIQPDKKLGFFYEEGPNDYCMVYRPISIEELTNDEYRMYDPETDGEIDEVGKALEEVKKEARKLLDDNAENHAEKPALGQFPTSEYEALKKIYEEATADSINKLKMAIAQFAASSNWPVFTINNMHPGYGVGKSIYDDGQSSLHFKETNKEDEQMQWKFAGLKSTEMKTGRYVVTNISTGKLFWGADTLVVYDTNPAESGQFIIKTNGSGDPVHAQQNGSVVVRWNDYKPNTGSAWSFTYVGESFEEEESGTGIILPENSNENLKEALYDLQGRKAIRPKKGIYITESGKKVLITE